MMPNVIPFSKGNLAESQYLTSISNCSCKQVLICLTAIYKMCSIYRRFCILTLDSKCLSIIDIKMSHSHLCFVRMWLKA